jgi:hypothetical protein
LLILSSCQSDNTDEIEIPSKYKQGDVVIFNADTSLIGIVMREDEYNKGIYVVSYFNKMGANQVDNFNEVEFKKKQL